MDLYSHYNNNSTQIPQTDIIDLDGNVRYTRQGTFDDPNVVIDIINELI